MGGGDVGQQCKFAERIWPRRKMTKLRTSRNYAQIGCFPIRTSTKWGTKKINKVEQKFKNVEKDNLNFNLVSRTPSAVPGDGLGVARSVGHFVVCV